MKMLKRSSITISVLTAAGILAGCVRSVHPLYTSSDVVYRESLVGTWEQSDQETTWQVTVSQEEQRDQAYRLVMTDDEGRPGTFLAHLVKLEDALFLDLFPIAPQATNNGLHRFHFQPVHTFLRVEIGEKTLSLAPMNPKWLEEHLQDTPDALPHTKVTPLGHPLNGDNGNMDEQLLLTASTSELQRFVRKHINTEGAFGDAVELRKLVR